MCIQFWRCPIERDSELQAIAHTFQRILSGRPNPDDLERCRSLEPLNVVLRAALLPGESEEAGSARLLALVQESHALRHLARAGGDHFDGRGRCRSPAHARDFIDAASSSISLSRLTPKPLICGSARVTENDWNDSAISHAPNFGAWTLQLVTRGTAELIWGKETRVCREGDIIVIPPQAATVHRVARGTAYYEEYWFHFAGTARWLQWVDWVPRLSTPAINCADEHYRELIDLAADVIAQNGSFNKLQHQLQETLFEQFLVRQRMRLGAAPVASLPEHAELAQRFMLDNLFQPLTLESIAQHCGLSCPHLSDVFKAATGIAPMQWRERERIKRAGELLQNSKLRVAEVAFLTGYEDYRHFTKRFRAVTGLTPTMYREA